MIFDLYTVILPSLSISKTCSLQVGVRCLEQWQNLLEYFLKFLPTTSVFKTSVMNTDCYKRLKERFQCKNSEAYLSFMSFVTQDFETFLRRFQFEQPMIHMLYPSIVEMIRSIMTKFIKKKYLVLEDGSPKAAEDILSVNPLRSEVSSIDFLLVSMTLQVTAMATELLISFYP